MDNLRFSKKILNEFQVSSFLKKDIFPQVLFESRDGHLYLGLGSIQISPQFLEGIPDGFSVFIQRDFYDEDSHVICPQLLLDSYQGKTTLWVQEGFNFENLPNLPEPQKQFQIKKVKLHPTKKEWDFIFKKVQEKLNENIFQKVVLAREVLLVLDIQPDTLKLFSEIQKTNHYNFYFATSPEDIFLGSSPERLLNIRQGILQTEAVAGTRIREKEFELLTSQKDLLEHGLVVRDILEKIKPFTQKVKFDERPSLAQTKNLSHLKTNIYAELKTSDFFGLLGSLHPTSAVCGMPRGEVKNFLKENETFQRTLYAGTLGILSKDHAEMAVTLRCCHIQKNSLRLYSGAGIVAQSDPQSEWNELNDKIIPYLKILNLQAPL